MCSYVFIGASLGSVVKSMPAMQVTQEMWVQSLGWEDPLEEEMATHSSILAWESHGQRSLVGYSPWGCKELDTTEHTHTIGLLIFLIYEWLSNHDLLIF